MAQGTLSISPEQVDVGGQVTLTIAIAGYTSGVVTLTANTDPGDASGWENVTLDASGNATVQVKLGGEAHYFFALSLDGEDVLDDGQLSLVAGPVICGDADSDSMSGSGSGASSGDGSGDNPQAPPAATTTAAPATSTTAAANQPSLAHVGFTLDPDDGNEHTDDSLQVSSDAKITLVWSTTNATGIRIDALGQFAAQGSTTLPTTEASYAIVALGEGSGEGPPYTISIHTHDPGEVVSQHTGVQSPGSLVTGFRIAAA